MTDVRSSGLEAEYRNAKLGDARRSQRLLRIVDRLADDPSVSFPTAFSESELEGAYRFFTSKGVTADAVLEPHVRQTLKRMTGDADVLVLHDSSTLSFGSEGYREGLGESTGGNQHMLAHVSLAVSGDGTRRPYGVLSLSRHVVSQAPRRGAREPSGALQERWVDQVERVHALGVEPERLVHVMDREADDYEVFDRIERLGGRFVVRMQHNRAVVEGGRIRDHLPQLAMKVERSVQLGSRGGHKGPKQKRIHPPRKERTASLAIGAESLQINRTSTASSMTAPTCSLNVVYVCEVDPPETESPVEWVLLTSEPIETTEQILQVVDWYRARWVIEELFKALKSGCSVEKRQLQSFHALSNALALLLPIAWRLLLLRHMARDQPTAPATTVLAPDEITVLRSFGRRKLPDLPTARDALLAVAALGGHLKRNGEPGWQTLARGLEKLHTLTEGWRLGSAAARRSDQS